MITNRSVGLWMLPSHIGSSRSALSSLQRDFDRVRTLEHPHIARLIELGCNGSQYYVTGERLDGEPLREILTHLLPERLEVSEADDIVRAIGSALIYAHEHGVAHGDVRPENVLVTMDRRFVLTNFLARRLAKVAGRPPRPADDVRGLARLAAELYTGTPSVQALRGASQGGVPPARLTAIRAVLEAAPHRDTSSVAHFLANAGLAPAGAAATARRTQRRRSWSLWRVVVPTAAVVAVGTLLASYFAAGGDWRESAIAIQQRGLEALHAVTARDPAPPINEPSRAVPLPAPPAREPQPAATTPAPAGGSAASAQALSDSEDASAEPPVSAPPAPATSVPDRDAPPATAPPPAPAIFTAAVAKTPARARPERDPAVFSLGLARIAVREDHSVVALEVLRSGDTTQQAAVVWWTTPDTAHVEDDYADVGRQTLTFPAGATVQRLLIPIVNDGVRESDEVFTVHVSAPRGGVMGSVTATRVTLHDDD